MKLPKQGTPVEQLKCKECGKTEAERVTCTNENCWHKPKPATEEGGGN